MTAGTMISCSRTRHHGNGGSSRFDYHRGNHSCTLGRLHFVRFLQREELLSHRRRGLLPYGATTEWTRHAGNGYDAGVFTAAFCRFSRKACNNVNHRASPPAADCFLKAKYTRDDKRKSRDVVYSSLLSTTFHLPLSLPIRRKCTFATPHSVDGPSEHAHDSLFCTFPTFLTISPLQQSRNLYIICFCLFLPVIKHFNVPSKQAEPSEWW